jgi:hypothetical protein
MQSLADSYAKAGRRDEALKLRAELEAIRQKVTAPVHPDASGKP